MKRNLYVVVAAITLSLVFSISTFAQHKHTGQKKSGMTGMNMTSMMQSAHHKLMMAYMKSMSAFGTTLRDQTTKSAALDVEVARATVSEIRHNLDAMEALHQKHMSSMSTDMQSQMKMMMEKMDKNRAMLKDQVNVLETDVQADKPDAAQVRLHANALLKHLGMMSMMHSGTKTGKKKTASMNMDMKRM